jgi:hypothetical protein
MIGFRTALRVATSNRGLLEEVTIALTIGAAPNIKTITIIEAMVTTKIDQDSKNGSMAGQGTGRNKGPTSPKKNDNLH